MAGKYPERPPINAVGALIKISSVMNKMDLFTMEKIAQAKQYLLPAVISVVAVGMLKMGIFVTPGELEEELRKLESSIRSEYATRQDIEDIKAMLNRLDVQLVRMEDRLNKR